MQEPHEMKSITYTEIKKEHQTGRNGMVIVVELWEIVYKSDLRIFSLGFFFSCLRHLSWEHHTNNALTSTSSVHFWEYFCKNLQCKKETKKCTKTNRRGLTSFHVRGDFPVGNRAGSFSLWCVLCEEHNWLFILPIPRLWGNVCDPHVWMTYWNHAAVQNLVPVTQKLICGGCTAAAS